MTLILSYFEFFLQNYIYRCYYWVFMEYVYSKYSGIVNCILGERKTKLRNCSQK